MKHYKHTSKISLAVLFVCSQLLTTNAALADSVYDWGPWNSAPPAEKKDEETFKNGNITTAEQNRLGDIGGELLVANAMTGAPSEWVGYNLAFSKDGPVAGSMQLLLENTGAPAGKGGNQFAGSAYIVGDFNGKPFVIDNNTEIDNLRYMFSDSEGALNTGRRDDGLKYVALEPILNNDPTGKYGTFGSFDSRKVEGIAYIGLPTPIAQIATLAAAGKTYNFSGYSFSGSEVSLKVDFQDASWKGTWSGIGNSPISHGHNGFKANGTIVGNTLTSSSVNGSGRMTNVGYVIGGQVNASFIGDLTDGRKSTAGIIGKTDLTVVESFKRNGEIKNTVAIGDIFKAEIGKDCNCR